MTEAPSEKLANRTEYVIAAEDVYKSFGDLEVLKGVSLRMKRGETLAFLGPSGSGKSTFLRCINQLEQHDSGAIYVDGELQGYDRRGNRLHVLSTSRVARQRRRTGMVFQGFNLFPHMTVLENIVMPMSTVHGVPRQEARERAFELLQRVGMADKTEAYPETLSGGQQQRVAIARALAPNPSVMLFDEPTSALDPELVSEVLEVIRDLASEGMSLIIVTHEIEFAREACSRAVILYDGVIIEEGAADKVLRNPENDRARQFLSRTLSS